MQKLETLEVQLKELKQYQPGLSGKESANASLEGSIAELWRLAALTYLSSIAKGDFANREAAEYFTQALRILDHVDYCDRPWPIFIIALQSKMDSQRSIVLTALERSLSRRPLGSIAVVNRLVRDAWTQQDLSGHDMDLFTLYGLIISRNRVPPCFT